MSGDGSFNQMDAALVALSGRTVSTIRRVVYVIVGMEPTATGPLEVSFLDGGTVTFRAGPDGEQLTIHAEPWFDPFVRSLSDDNRRFVEASGEWIALDASAEPGFAGFIGQPIVRASEIRSDLDGVTGAVLEREAGTIRIEVVADELLIHAV